MTKLNGVTHFIFSSRYKALRGLLLLLLAILTLMSCDLFDIFPPEIEIISPEENVSYFGTLPCSLKVTDNRAVTKVEIFLDGASVHEFTKSPYKTDISLDQYSAASVNLKAIAHDQAGNSAEASLEVNVTIGLKLTAPNGGESWNEQSTQTVTWESSGNIGSTVGLSYSTDGGSTWDEIIGSTANNGTYTWTLPNLVETQSACKVRVSTSQYADESDDTFTISAGSNILTLTSPNGGETWAEQSTQTITWSYSGDVGDSVSLHYSLDGGANWIEIITSTPNDGSHSWTLPNLTETHTACRVKVASTSYSDISNADFTITTEANYITVTSPNGGEEWPEQSTQTITWTSSGDVGDYVSLHYSLDDGTNWTEIIASTPNDGSHSWTLPDLTETTTTCCLKVASTSYSDISNANFTIMTEVNYITVTSPNGGEVWPEQSTQTITWTSSGDVGDYVSLHYSLDGGTSWTPIIAPTQNDGSQAWILPNLSETFSTCRVKITSTSSSFADTSDADFTITGGEITITSPDGGENWREWSTQTITWTSSGDVGNYVALYYSLNGGISWTEITASTLNNGSYSWILPTIEITQTTCQAKVSSITTGHYDTSDGNFTMGNWVPTLVGSYDTPGQAKDVFFSDAYAYVADYSSGLQVIDISNPASPTLASSYDMPGYAWGVFVTGGYAYVADGWSGLLIINVSNPASPTLAGTYNTPDYANKVFVSGSYAYVSDNDSLQIIDISSPASPILAGSCDIPDDYACGVFVSGSYAYVTDRRIGLQIIDISSPASPTLTGSYDMSSNAEGVFVSGSYAYVAERYSGLQIINISNPASPTLAGSYDMSGYAWGVFVTGGYAYVAGGYSGLQIINVSNPASPTLAGSCDTPDNALGVFVSGSYAYVADDASGLQIIDVSGLP